MTDCSQTVDPPTSDEDQPGVLVRIPNDAPLPPNLVLTGTLPPGVDGPIVSLVWISTNKKQNAEYLRTLIEMDMHGETKPPPGVLKIDMMLYLLYTLSMVSDERNVMYAMITIYKGPPKDWKEQMDTAKAEGRDIECPLYTYVAVSPHIPTGLGIPLPKWCSYLQL